MHGLRIARYVALLYTAGQAHALSQAHASYALFDQHFGIPQGCPNSVDACKNEIHVTGHIKFEQRLLASGKSDTIIEVKLKGLPKSVPRYGVLATGNTGWSSESVVGSGFAWHVHEFPKSGPKCDSSSVGPHFRPRSRNPSECASLPRVSCAATGPSGYVPLALWSKCESNCGLEETPKIQVCDQPREDPPTSMEILEEKCEAGDLSGKHGKLHPQFAPGAEAGEIDMIFEEESFSSSLGLPMFGKDSIVGRSVILHITAQGIPTPPKPEGDGLEGFTLTAPATSAAYRGFPGAAAGLETYSPDVTKAGVHFPFLCATIGYTAPVVRVQVEFEGAVQGLVTLQQVEHDPTEDTSIFVQLSKAGATTTGHHLRIHDGTCSTMSQPSGPVCEPAPPSPPAPFSPPTPRT